MTRVVFTEFDHNYVNLASERHAARIEASFQPSSRWVGPTGDRGNYPSPVAQFNEYMTWAVFSLYARDRYAPEHFEVIHERTVEQMVQARGFVEFRAFDAELLRVTQKGEPFDVDQLYAHMLDWIEAESPSQ